MGCDCAYDRTLYGAWLPPLEYVLYERAERRVEGLEDRTCGLEADELRRVTVPDGRLPLDVDVRGDGGSYDDS